MQAVCPESVSSSYLEERSARQYLAPSTLGPEPLSATSGDDPEEVQILTVFGS